MKIQYKIFNDCFDTNFLYSGVDYEYDDYICDDGNCGCRDGSDYCRCSHHEGLRVKDIDLIRVRNNILEKSQKRKSPILTEDTFLHYCVDRLLVKYKAFESEMWCVIASRGYYGEEVDKIVFEDNSLFKDIRHLHKCAPNARIEFVLEKEYGHLLSSLIGKKYKNKKVLVSDLIVSNTEYYKKIDSSEITLDETLPIGIYLKDGEKYKLVDGYHRYLLNKDKKEVDIIFAE